MFQYHYRLIGIGKSTFKLEYDFPIHSYDKKKEVITLLGITRASLIPEQKYTYMDIEYDVVKNLRFKSKEKPSNYFSYSIKEILVDDMTSTRILKIIDPYTDIVVQKNLLWKLCISKTIEDEFYS